MNIMQCRHRQAWLEGKVPGPGTLAFPPSLEDTLAIWIDNSYICLGEHDGAAKISKWPQAYQGVGEGGHGGGGGGVGVDDKDI